MRDISQVTRELEAVHKKQDELYRWIAVVTIKAIRERSEHHARLNPFGPEMRILDALLKDVHRPDRKELLSKEVTVHSLADDAINKPRTHGLIFFHRVVSSPHFKAATGLSIRKWMNDQDALAYKSAVLSVELDKLREVASGRRQNVEVVRV